MFSAGLYFVVYGILLFSQQYHYLVVFAFFHFLFIAMVWTEIRKFLFAKSIQFLDWHCSSIVRWVVVLGCIAPSNYLKIIKQLKSLLNRRSAVENASSGSLKVGDCIVHLSWKAPRAMFSLCSKMSIGELTIFALSMVRQENICSVFHVFFF